MGSQSEIPESVVDRTQRHLFNRTVQGLIVDGQPLKEKSAGGAWNTSGLYY